ncbi:MAG: SIR2 family protein [Balneolaceae bacterium]
MKVVLFLGAGFSKAIFNQKIQSELLEDFLTAPESEVYVKKFPKEFIELTSTFNDIELIMSHYLNLGYPESYIEDDETLYNKRFIVLLRMALAIYFREKFKKGGYEYYNSKSEYLIHDYFHGYGVVPDDLSVITTNYDLGAERAVETIKGMGSYFYPGFQKVVDTRDKVPIMKLHGSINWIEARGTLSRIGFANNTRKEIITDILDDLTFHEFTLQKDGTKYAPVLVPFFYQKQLWSKINQRWWGKRFDELWHQAFKALIDADLILFWGYSLPNADHHMFTLLQTALTRSNANIQIIDKLNKNSPETNLMKLAYLSRVSEPDKLEVSKHGLSEYLRSIVET